MVSDEVDGYKQVSDGEIKLVCFFDALPVGAIETRSGFYTFDLNQLSLEQAKKVAALLKVGL